MIKDLKKIRVLLSRDQNRALIILSGLFLIAMFFEMVVLRILLPILTILFLKPKGVLAIGTIFGVSALFFSNL